MLVLYPINIPSGNHALYTGRSCPLLVGQDGLFYRPNREDKSVQQNFCLYNDTMPELPRPIANRLRQNCFFVTKGGSLMPANVTYHNKQRSCLAIMAPPYENRHVIQIEELRLFTAGLSVLKKSKQYAHMPKKNPMFTLLFAEYVMAAAQFRIAEPMQVGAAIFSCTADEHSDQGITAYYDLYQHRLLNAWDKVDKGWTQNSFNPFLYYINKLYINSAYPYAKRYHFENPPVQLYDDPPHIEDLHYLRPIFAGYKKIGYYEGTITAICEKIATKLDTLLSLLISKGWEIPESIGNEQHCYHETLGTVYPTVPKKAETYAKLGYHYPALRAYYDMLLNALRKTPH